MPFNLKDKKINLILVLAASIAIFSLYKYVSSIGELNSLRGQAKIIQDQINALSKENQKLLQDLEKEKNWVKKVEEENSGLKYVVRNDDKYLSCLKNSLEQAQVSVNQLNSQITSLKEENANIKAQEEQLKLNYATITKENEDFKAKFNSVDELKKAIKDLRCKMRKVKVEIKEEIKTEKAEIDGNRGFVVRDGKPTFPAKIKIEVIPAQS